ncbi:MAG: Clp protease ClpP [Lachnospiraceae bacterium]|nr:Clp protease ClpP [Lachnospiraceae bacterium]
MKNKKYYALETNGSTAQIVIFGDITSWPWLESDVSSYNFQKEVSALDVDEIEVHINSYGGEVAEALAITNTLMRHKAKITTYVDGFACSAATIVFMAGERRVISPLANFLVHPAWMYTQGNADDLRKTADDLDRITEQSIKAYMARISKSREELEALMKEDRFMTPEEVLEWGFATEIDALLEEENPSQSVREKVAAKLQAGDVVRINLDASKVAGVILSEMERLQAKQADPEEPDDDPKDPDNPDDPDEDPEKDPDDDPDEETTKETALYRFLEAFN